MDRKCTRKLCGLCSEGGLEIQERDTDCPSCCFTVNVLPHTAQDLHFNLLTGGYKSTQRLPEIKKEKLY